MSPTGRSAQVRGQGQVLFPDALEQQLADPGRAVLREVGVVRDTVDGGAQKSCAEADGPRDSTSTLLLAVRSITGTRCAVPTARISAGRFTPTP
ncbi:hypothetical protein STRIP9103_00135 [Streptomyces ipomoeae 91-03]|uniref:Uncharacterized protein n=1 Tax=Streptomyces ipomoeae 91-03 TaxID=698759 RepID=L1KVB4_9ACTN|nr:hypothetical protein STRIP9103_00135 [Streptomyces ipomoeae 91-03]